MITHHLGGHVHVLPMSNRLLDDDSTPEGKEGTQSRENVGDTALLRSRTRTFIPLRRRRIQITVKLWPLLWLHFKLLVLQLCLTQLYSRRRAVKLCLNGRIAPFPLMQVMQPMQPSTAFDGLYISENRRLVACVRAPGSGSSTDCGGRRAGGSAGLPPGSSHIKT